jgi:hypothetical protein
MEGLAGNLVDRVRREVEEHGLGPLSCPRLRKVNGASRSGIQIIR